MSISGDRSVDIDAPIEQVYAIAANLEGAVDWQRSLRSVDVISRDGEGRPQVIETVSDAKVKTVKSRLRYAFNAPSSITWQQEKGDVKDVSGSWTFEDLGDGRTKATYAMNVDPGRMLGMLLRGGAEASVTNFMLGDPVDGLKRQAES